MATVTRDLDPYLRLPLTVAVDVAVVVSPAERGAPAAARVVVVAGVGDGYRDVVGVAWVAVAGVAGVVAVVATSASEEEPCVFRVLSGPPPPLPAGVVVVVVVAAGHTIQEAGPEDRSTHT